MGQLSYSYLKAMAYKNVLIPSLKVILLFVFFIVLSKVINHTLNKLAQKNKDNANRKNTETLIGLLRGGLRALLIVVFIFTALEQYGVSIRPLLASAGVVGLAVGFGAQNLVKDVISGFFILFENQMRVGDVVTINGQSGVVEEMRFRTTVLRDVTGTVHIFPNSTISRVSNMTKDWSAYVTEVSIAYHNSVEHAIEVIKSVFTQLKQDPEYSDKIISDIEIFGLDRFADSALIIKARIKTKPSVQWSVGREFNRQLKQAFDKEGIEIPFPQTTLTLGNVGDVKKLLS